PWGAGPGWGWGCFLAPAPGPALVFTRTTDRAHREFGQPLLTVRAAGTRRTFVGSAVGVVPGMLHVSRVRRLPGGLAALHQDRLAPALPASMRITASDGIDDVGIGSIPEGAPELVAAESA